MVYTAKRLKEEYISFLENNKDNEIKENLKIIDSFKLDFPVNKIRNITLDEYVVWKLNEYWETNTDSFCYRLERWDTSVLWSIRWWTAIKFWIYYSKDKKEYRYTNKFEDKDDAINRIGKFLYSLSKLDNFSQISNLEDNNILSPMVIRKVFYMYNSEKIIPIFSTEVLLEKINKILWTDFNDYVEAQLKILDIYNEINREEKSTYSFMIFLYKISNITIDNETTDLIIEKNIINKIEEEEIISKEETNFKNNNKEKKEVEEVNNMINDREIKNKEFAMRKVEFDENMKMKIKSFNIVIILMSIEIIVIFIIFFLVWIDYLKFSDNNLNIFIWATIAQITAIFFFIIKHLFPLNK